jgi:hypothetical protein
MLPHNERYSQNVWVPIQLLLHVFYKLLPIGPWDRKPLKTTRSDVASDDKPSLEVWTLQTKNGSLHSEVFHPINFPNGLYNAINNGSNPLQYLAISEEHFNFLLLKDVGWSLSAATLRRNPCHPMAVSLNFFQPRPRSGHRRMTPGITNKDSCKKHKSV